MQPSRRRRGASPKKIPRRDDEAPSAYPANIPSLSRYSRPRPASSHSGPNVGFPPDSDRHRGVVHTSAYSQHRTLSRVRLSLHSCIPSTLAEHLISLLHDGRRRHGRQCPPGARLRRAFPWTDATQVLSCYGVSKFLGGEVDVCKCCGAWREVSQHQPGDDSTDA